MKTSKLGRTAEHRKAMLANQVCSLIEHSRIKTTLAKAKAVKPLAEKMVTLGKKGSLHARRTAIAVLHQPKAVKKLFEEIAPRAADREGGYTRIIKLAPRKSDSAPVAFIEWVDAVAVEDDDVIEVTPAKATKPKADKAPKKEKAEKAEPKAKTKADKAEEPAAE